MAKTRRAAMPNSTAIDILIAKENIKKNDGIIVNKYSTVWKDNKGWYHVKRGMHNVYEYSWMVPMHTWRKHINKRFKAEFPLGNMVRIRQASRRDRTRNGNNQDVGVSQSFKHLGIGTGKAYLTDRMKEAQASIYKRYNSTPNEGTQIIIGAEYASNLIAAVNHSKWCNSQGMKIKRWHYMEDTKANDFLEFTQIKPDGIYGPKKLINGYVTNVFVHFLEPRWNTKRECRYELTFDNGVKGIWTNDYMQRVFDEDYGLDEHMMEGCPQGKTCSASCNHKLVHMYDDRECNDKCWRKEGHVCQTIYDYTNFFDTTHKLGMELKDDKA
jgi:hypothetical protein